MDALCFDTEAALRPRSWAEVDLDAFAANVARARALAPAGRVLAVLKADAYGHGAVAVARAARAAGVVMLGVGDSTEALELRRAGIETPILVLGSLVPVEIPEVLAAGVTPVVHSRRRVEDLAEVAARLSRPVPVHLKVDTGMGRLGLRPGSALEVAKAIKASRHLVFDGLMSHLAGPTTDGPETHREQALRFAGLVESLARLGLLPPNIHLRNSGGILDRELSVPGETMVRAGALLFGFSPSGKTPPEGFAPVLSLRTQIVYLKDLGVGHGVGYGATFVTSRPTRLAIIPLGYHDGVKRALGNRGSVLVRGRPVPIVGHVSMDYTTLDVTEVPGARVGDVVTLIGRDEAARIPVEEVAARAGTIPYDVLSGLGRRVVRLPSGEAMTPR